jgi:molybdopterin-guanine dinucleotide biosynthesis protein A
MIDKDDITGLILAGGRGSRMGGADKGLQNFRGMPWRCSRCCACSRRWARSMINANRNLAAYESFGVPVWPDALPDFAGPLAGFLTGLERCETEYLVTVPCDTPLFPQDLVARLAEAPSAGRRDRHGQPRPRRTASARRSRCSRLLRRELMESLVRFTQGGGRKIDAWTAQHRTVAGPVRPPGRRRAPSSTPTRWPNCTGWRGGEAASRRSRRSCRATTRRR